MKEQTAAKTRARTARQTLIRRQIAIRLRLIKGQLAEIDRVILERIDGDPDLSARMAILTSIPGIAAITAITMLIEMPELGTLSNKQAASLAGLAPISRQSGKWQGKESIRGGRGHLRRALYLPALTAMRFNEDLRGKTEALAERGKPGKLITAIMRNLVVLANVLLTDGRKWAPRRSWPKRILRWVFIAAALAGASSTEQPDVIDQQRRSYFTLVQSCPLQKREIHPSTSSVSPFRDILELYVLLSSGSQTVPPEYFPPPSDFMFCTIGFPRFA
jgi:hypothetical protein